MKTKNQQEFGLISGQHQNTFLILWTCHKPILYIGILSASGAATEFSTPVTVHNNYNNYNTAIVLVFVFYKSLSFYSFTTVVWLTPNVQIMLFNR